MCCFFFFKQKTASEMRISDWSSDVCFSDLVRRQLEPLVAGRAVVEGWGHPSSKFASAPLAGGATIEGVGRKGKYLLLELDDGRQLIVHLGMTGQLRLRPGSDIDPYISAERRVGKDCVST